jgi:hypothetical protein
MLLPPTVGGLAWFAFAASGWAPDGVPGIVGGALLGVIGYVGAAALFLTVGLGLAMDSDPASGQPPPSAVRYVIGLCIAYFPFIVVALAVILIPLALLMHLI